MSGSAKQSKQVTKDPVLVVAELPSGRDINFEIEFDADQKKAAAQQLDLLELQKLRFTGKISPHGKSDWVLTGMLGATVTQPCAVTLAPVTTRIDVPVRRLYLRDYEEIDAPEGVTTPRIAFHVRVAGQTGR